LNRTGSCIWANMGRQINAMSSQLSVILLFIVSFRILNYK
jgi:hypothetical protein